MRRFVKTLAFITRRGLILNLKYMAYISGQISTENTGHLHWTQVYRIDHQSGNCQQIILRKFSWEKANLKFTSSCLMIKQFSNILKQKLKNYAQNLMFQVNLVKRLLTLVTQCTFLLAVFLSKWPYHGCKCIPATQCQVSWRKQSYKVWKWSHKIYHLMSIH